MIFIFVEKQRMAFKTQSQAPQNREHKLSENQDKNREYKKYENPISLGIFLLFITAVRAST